MTTDNRLTFGGDARAYRTFRPDYPAELFAFLVENAPGTGSALDLATGTGQAATRLAAHFDRVVAVDISAELLAEAPPAPRVSYRVAAAEELPPDLGRFDVVASAQAAHWFDPTRFWPGLSACCDRATLVALWGYCHAEIDPEIDRRIRKLVLEPIDPYWAAGNRIVLSEYRDLDFPLREISAPRFHSDKSWTLETLIGYLRTWSAYKRYREVHEDDPVRTLGDGLTRDGLWSDGERRTVRFPVFLRAGRPR